MFSILSIVMRKMKLDSRYTPTIQKPLFDKLSNAALSPRRGLWSMMLSSMSSIMIIDNSAKVEWPKKNVNVFIGSRPLIIRIETVCLKTCKCYSEYDKLAKSTGMTHSSIQWWIMQIDLWKKYTSIHFSPAKYSNVCEATVRSNTGTSDFLWSEIENEKSWQP